MYEVFFTNNVYIQYLVKDQVEKLGAKVVKDTSQSTMEIRFVYVVKVKMTATSFVEVSKSRNIMMTLSS